jgi:carbon storage regulator CsrA
VLVLSRKVGERVVLPDCGVTVEVVAVSGKRVRLGFAAPGGTRIHRNEVWNRIRDEIGIECDEPGEAGTEIALAGTVAVVGTERGVGGEALVP